MNVRFLVGCLIGFPIGALAGLLLSEYVIIPWMERHW